MGYDPFKQLVGTKNAENFRNSQTGKFANGVLNPTNIQTGSNGISVAGIPLLNRDQSNIAGRAIQTGGLSLIAPRPFDRAYGSSTSITPPGPGSLPGVDTSGKPLYPTLRSTLDQNGALKKEYSSAGTWLPMAQKQLQAGTATSLNQAQASGNQALQQGMGALASRGGLTSGASERMALKSGLNTGDKMMDTQNQASQQGLNLATQAGQSDLGQLMSGTTQANQQAMEKFGYDTADYQNKVQAQVLARQAEEARRAAEAERNAGGLSAIMAPVGAIGAGVMSGGNPAAIQAGYQAGAYLPRLLNR